MLYFLRHGESVANVNGVFAGQKDDTLLSDVGIQQARQAGIELANLKISRIIASRLKRTQQTAIEVAGVVGFDPSKIENDDRILEYDMGAITGTPIRKVSSHELVAAKDAEDPKEVRDRILSFLREYKDSPEVILIVSHAGVGRAIEAARQGLDPADFYDLPAYQNGHAFQLELDWLE
jgi:2,3-bisphosphoglycerate-dependent phosphoglycerate mutase